MEDIRDKIDAAIVDDEAAYGVPTKAVPKPEVNIGIDTKNTLLSNIANAGVSSQLDLAAIQSFTQIGQRRDTIYSLLDSMCQDSMVAAILETYCEDATERNDEGHIVWAESSDANVSRYINYLLQSCGVDKNVYSWACCLSKYGDLYLRLYRKSDYDASEELFSDVKTDILQEKVQVQAYAKNDHYVHYLEKEPNPAELFELTKFGKTQGYIKAQVSTNTTNTTPLDLQSIFRFKRGDVTIFGPTEYVHGALEDNSSRTPEQVDIFLDSQNMETESAKYSYKVRRGQSLFYDAYKSWRELKLLENSLLLNRITKSAVTRMINVEVGDMPKEMVGPHLQGVKQLFEQKLAYNVNNSISEYNNPGPIENNVYMPTHGGIGAVTATTVGGDVNVGDIVDVKAFRSNFFGSLGIPQQYMGYTDDSAGFSGGESLSIISSRYAKKVKRIQTVLIQTITDAINLMLLDKKLNSYIGKFEIHMVPPATSEETARKEAVSNSVRLVADIMNMLTDVPNQTIRLEILKSMLSNVVTDGQVVNLIQQQIDELEAAEKDGTAPQEEPSEGFDDEGGFDFGADLGLEPKEEPAAGEEPVAEPSEEVILPTPEETGAGDMTDMEMS